MGGNKPLDLPVGLGHFLPWFTVRGGDFPLDAGDAATITAPPTIEDLRHWCDARASYRRTHRDFPQIGRYDSRDPATLRWQFAAMNDAGLSGMIINWYGQNSVENVLTLGLLRELTAWNEVHPDRALCYCLSIDSQAQQATEGKTPVSLDQDLAYIQKHLIRPGYLQRNERPVFLCFPYENDLPHWLAAFDGCFGEQQYDFHWMNEPQGVGETGVFLWVEPDESTVDHTSPYPWQDPGNCGAERAGKRYLEWSASHYGLRYGVAGVWPGFDDTLVAWAWKPEAQHGRVRPRIIARENEGGACYGQLWEAYVSALSNPIVLPLPIVQIVTWNDWAESTQIEPSVDHRDDTVRMTRHYLEIARHQWRHTCPS
ncbi:MAG: hypothetical protein AAF711_00220 [Planctomycetota bacterium]